MSRTSYLALTLASLAAAFASSCGGEAPPELPRLRDGDHYAYSLAVAGRARELVPDDRPLAVLNLGKVHERFGRQEEALAVYREAIEGTITDRQVAAEMYTRTGRICSLTDRGAEAIRAYQLALRNDPGRRGLWSRIGLVLSHMPDRQAEAIAALETEVRHGTADETTWVYLGLAYKSLERWQDAVKSYEEALALAPETREALYGLHEALRRIGDPERAAEYLARWKGLKEADQSADIEARRTAPVEDGRKLAAETWYDAAGLFIEEHNRALDEPERRSRYLALCLDALDRGLELDPRLRAAHELRLDIFLKSGRTAEHLDATRQASEAFPEDPQLAVILAQRSLERIAAERGSGRPTDTYRDEARRALERAVATAPNLPAASGMLAELYLKSFPQDRALQARALELAQKALDLTDAPGADAYDILAFAHVRNGSVSAARAVLARGIEQVPPVEREQLRARLEQLDTRIRGAERP